LSQINRDKAIDFMRYQRHAEAIPFFSELINDDPNDWYTKAADSLMNSTYSIIKNT